MNCELMFVKTVPNEFKNPHCLHSCNARRSARTCMTILAAIIIHVYKKFLKISKLFQRRSFRDLAQPFLPFFSTSALSFQACNLVVSLDLVPRDRHLEWGRFTRGAHVHAHHGNLFPGTFCRTLWRDNHRLGLGRFRPVFEL